MVEKKHGKLSSLRIEEILEPFEIHLDTGGNIHVNNTENSGELAGISRPACLMFLNNPDPPHLSAAKKEELAALIYRYQYRSNWAARSLRGKKLQLAGIAGHLFRVPIHSVMIEVLNRRLWENGYQTLLGGRFPGWRGCRAAPVSSGRSSGLPKITIHSTSALNGMNEALRESGGGIRSSLLCSFRMMWSQPGICGHWAWSGSPRMPWS